MIQDIVHRLRWHSGWCEWYHWRDGGILKTKKVAEFILWMAVKRGDHDSEMEIRQWIWLH